MPTDTGMLCAGETLETLMSNSRIEQFYDLCPSCKEFHINNILPEVCSKKKSKVLWGPTQAAEVSCPSATSSASVCYSTVNQRVEAGHRQPRSCDSSTFVFTSCHWLTSFTDRGYKTQHVTYFPYLNADRLWV